MSILAAPLYRDWDIMWPNENEWACTLVGVVNTDSIIF